MKILTGLENLIKNKKWQSAITGKFGVLCHAASIDRNFKHTVDHLQNIYGDRLVKLFGPQHGFVCDVQDNMIETKTFVHPHYGLPVYSLYSETRIPTDEMLAGLDSIVVDLQDVGTRVYTYIHTLSLLMEKCGQLEIKVVVLDRPNPVGGKILEGQILEPGWESFVGRFAIPQRHGLTMGEMAFYCKKYHECECELEVIPMEGWQRSMFFHELELPWVNPSPNLPTIESSYVFPGTVLFEGTNISEGRGTTRSLEIVGHPKLDPYKFLDFIKNDLTECKLEGFILRPMNFYPMFQKHADRGCGGIHIHPTDMNKFRPWFLGQLLCKKLYDFLKDDFEWKEPGYEYNFELKPIDLINGSDKIRKWMEASGTYQELKEIESDGMQDYRSRSESIHLYK